MTMPTMASGCSGRALSPGRDRRRAQIRSATITGTVTDSTGAVLPGATVVVTNQDTNVDHELVTNDAGLFTAPYLAAGTYTVTRHPRRIRALQTDRHRPSRTAQTVRVAVELKISDARRDGRSRRRDAPLLQTDSASGRGRDRRRR